MKRRSKKLLLRKELQMNNFDNYLVDYFKDITESDIRSAMLYAIADGKKFRPSLLFSVLDSFGIDRKYGYACALALEMVHTYSLIHDDLPCMDDDDLRRNKPSVHKAFGEAEAVLAGDGLLTESFLCICNDKYLNSDQKIHAIAILARMAGASGMIYGQFLDMRAENKTDISMDELFDIDDHKTGCLFQCAFLLGMIIVKDVDNQDFYMTIGKKIGRIFQIQDDLFDKTRSSKQTGKSNSDIDNNKSTIFSLMGIGEIEKMLEREFDDIYDLLDHQTFDTRYIRDIICKIQKR